MIRAALNESECQKGVANWMGPKSCACAEGETTKTRNGLTLWFCIIFPSNPTYMKERVGKATRSSIKTLRKLMPKKSCTYEESE